MKRVVLLLIVLTLLHGTAFAATLNQVSDEETPVSGAGTAADPYCYTIGSNARVTWKHLANIKEQGVTDCYEYAGDLFSYRWVFRPEEITSPEGPYFLGIRTYPDKDTQDLPGAPDAFYFSFALKRELPGSAEITLSVPERFSEGEALYLTWYGGSNGGSAVHGAAPEENPDELRQFSQTPVCFAERPVVRGGSVTVHVTKGGNYVLSRKELSFAGYGASAVTHYDPGKVLGAIHALFRSAPLAQAVADTLGRDPGDTVTQGDLDGITRLYVKNADDAAAEDLAALWFGGLTSLTLTDGDLKTIPELSMPTLTNLDLSGNSLTDITALRKLPSLRHINASKNALTALPMLDALTALETLDLSENALTVLPAVKLPRLAYLNVSGNNLTVLRDPSFAGCPALEEADTGGQQFFAELTVQKNQNCTLVPAPELIGQLAGSSGGVVITDSGGKTVFEQSYDEFVKAGYTISSSQFEKSGRYTVLVTGEREGQAIGSYQYSVTVGKPEIGHGTRRAAGLGIVIILVTVCFVVLLLRSRKIRKQEETNE